MDHKTTSILVLSDIHATDGDPNLPDADSYVSMWTSGTAGTVDPFGSMCSELSLQNTLVGCVLCPGDLTNKGDKRGIGFVWERLRNVSTELKCPILIATPGNHDLDSRYQQSSYDARGQAMLIRPPLPTGDRDRYLEFWAEHFTTLQSGDIRFVILDTCAFHGGGLDQKAEMEKGRVSEPTLELLRDSLQRDGKRVLNVLICHHHPIAHDEIIESDYSAISGGNKLVRLLGDSDFGPWFIVHGHKHRPRMAYGPGGANAPTVFGAASFSAQINRDAQNKSPNQFHLVNFHMDEANTLGFAIAGQVLSWNWTIGEGWRPASGPHGLPRRAGFGFRGSVDVVARDIMANLASAEFFEWRELVGRIPSLAYLLPVDLARLLAILRSGGARVLEDGGLPAQASLSKDRVP